MISFYRSMIAGVLLLACSTSPGSGVTPAKDAGPVQVEASVPRAQQPAHWDNEIRSKELLDENPDPAIVEVSLEAKLETVAVPGGPSLTLWTFNGQVPGPTIRVRKGNELRVKVKNSLPEPTTIHWHGVRVPNRMDGTEMVQKPIEPGATFVYDYVLKDEGTYWYHPHVKSSPQVGFGLYGALIVEPELPDGLPEDLPIVLSDLSVDKDEKLAPGNESGGFGDFFGREGKYVLVNGRVSAKVTMRSGLGQRWRFVNAARARYFSLAFPGLEVHRIGGDGGRMEKSIKIQNTLLVPGERAEFFVVATGAAGSVTNVENKSYDRFHAGASPGTSTPLFQVSVSADAAVSKEVPPAKLVTIPRIDVSSLKERPFEFSQVPLNAPTGFGINGKQMKDLEPFVAQRNTDELWTVTNASGMDHPFHLHGFFFQVVKFNGVAPPVLEWKDTINLIPKDTMQIAVQFDNRPGMWMFHCHILDHADAGMMAMLNVE